MSGVTLYCEIIPDPGGSVVLSERESHHAVRVRRLREGDAVRLIDGQGCIGHAVISGISQDNSIAVDIHERSQQCRPKCTIHLASALAKGDRQRVLLDMLTQLGIVSFTPLACERSIVRASDNSQTRWLRFCIEACKQSGNAYVPILHAESVPSDFVRRCRDLGAVCLIAQPRSAITNEPYFQQESVGVMVGPEGGFTETEIASAIDAGAEPVSIGTHTLRIETAAVGLVSAIRFAAGPGHTEGSDS